MFGARSRSAPARLLLRFLRQPFEFCFQLHDHLKERKQLTLLSLELFLQTKEALVLVAPRHVVVFSCQTFLALWGAYIRKPGQEDRLV